MYKQLDSTDMSDLPSSFVAFGYITLSNQIQSAFLPGWISCCIRRFDVSFQTKRTWTISVVSSCSSSSSSLYLYPDNRR